MDPVFLARLLDLLDTLPFGFDTWLGEYRAHMIVGERQRVFDHATGVERNHRQPGPVGGSEGDRCAGGPGLSDDPVGESK